MLRDYEEVRRWLESFIPYTYSKSNLGLERISYLLKLLENPEKKFKSILVGGTSGKGSTAYYLARALYKVQRPDFVNRKSKTISKHQISNINKLKVGLHISPHLTYIGERMQINGRLISPNRLLKLINEVKPKVESMEKAKIGPPSYFEIFVALSFLYFAKEKVDWAVVEVGLGGRLDATNVLKSNISVITNVGLDHTEILGDTIEEVAKEKAGIIKGGEDERGYPVVTAASGKALEVIKKVARSKKSQVITINTLRKQHKPYLDILRDVNIHLDSVFGKVNHYTNECFFLVNLSLLTLGIKLELSKQKKVFSAKFMGRFEEIDRGIFVDGAHNREKVRVLINWVKKIQRLRTREIKSRKIILVCAFKKGKDWEGILRLLIKELDIERIHATQFVTPTDTGFFSSVDPLDVRKFVELSWPKVTVKAFDNSQEAVFKALSRVRGTRGQGDKGMVLITGSLYLVGEARTLWELPTY